MDESTDSWSSTAMGCPGTFYDSIIIDIAAIYSKEIPRIIESSHRYPAFKRQLRSGTKIDDN